MKQDRAYIIAGKPDANGKYNQEQKAFWANIHRAHSGRRGIVNSYESFREHPRFLFGNIKAEILFENITVATPKLPKSQIIITTSGLPSPSAACPFSSINASRTLAKTRSVTPRRLRDQDHPTAHRLHELEPQRWRPRNLTRISNFNSACANAPSRTAFSGTANIRKKPSTPRTSKPASADLDAKTPGAEVQFRWLSEGGDWKNAEESDDGFRVPLRTAGPSAGTSSSAPRSGPTTASNKRLPDGLETACLAAMVKVVEASKGFVAVQKVRPRNRGRALNTAKRFRRNGSVKDDACELAGPPPTPPHQ